MGFGGERKQIIDLRGNRSYHIMGNLPRCNVGFAELCLDFSRATLIKWLQCNG